MNHIHTIMARNVARHQERLNKETRRRTRRELESLEPQIHAHNLQVKQNFEDIFAESFAHDEHIHSAVLAENQLKNITIGKIQEIHKDEPVDFEFDNTVSLKGARRLILKTDKAQTLQHLTSDKITIVKK
jgi:tRNA(Ile)-lysidine synthase TilS/MesJ